MSQFKTKRVSVSSLMNRRAFVQGHDETVAGVPFNAQAFAAARASNAWAYERGRVFGLVYPGPVKNGQRVTLAARLAFEQAFRDGTII